MGTVQCHPAGDHCAPRRFSPPRRSSSRPALLLVALSSCSSKLRFPVNYTSDPALSHVKKLVINKIEVAEEDTLVLKDQLGHWTESKSKGEFKALKTLIRESLKANLEKYAQFEILDLNETDLLTHARFSNLAPKTGFRKLGVDTVLNLKLTVSAVSQEGQIQKVESFRSSASRKVKQKKGYKWQKVEDQSVDKVVTYPYQSQMLSLLLSIELIDVRNGEYKVLKGVNDTYVLSFIHGGSYPEFGQTEKDSPMYQLDHSIYSQKPPTLDAIVQRAVILTGTKILPHVSSFKLMVTREIDTGGEEKAVEFLEKGQVEEALNLLQQVTSVSKEEVSASDKYNLGLCYEVVGEPKIALQLYEEALLQDEGNETYIQAIGGVESLYLK